MAQRHLRLRLPRSRRDAYVLAMAVVAMAGVLLPGDAVGRRGDPPPDAAGTRADQGIEQLPAFLWGLAGEESGWDWTARNGTSGAYGRYQVMPQNWPVWAGRYLGDRFADPTPHNQAVVVRHKVSDLFSWLGSWRRVAYWWLTGDTRVNEDRWSHLARGYVDDVTALASRAPAGGDPVPPAPGPNAPPASRGDWRYVVGDDIQLVNRVHGGKAVIDVLRDGQVLFVQDLRRNGDGVAWLRVSTADHLIGYVSIRWTFPAGRPGEPARWPRQGRVSPPRDGGGDGGRDRARPRPH